MYGHLYPSPWDSADSVHLMATRKQTAWERRGLLRGRPLPTTAFQALIPVNYVSPKFLMFLIVHRVRRHSMEKTALSLSPPNTAAFETKPKQRHCRSHTRKAICNYKSMNNPGFKWNCDSFCRMSECSREHGPTIIQCPANLAPPLHIGIWGFCIPPKRS